MAQLIKAVKEGPQEYPCLAPSHCRLGAVLHNASIGEFLGVQPVKRYNSELPTASCSSGSTWFLQLQVVTQLVRSGDQQILLAQLKDQTCV